ncbi:hypothetical protein MAAFP003_2647 [Mycobacterium ahvazicum]|uniref:Uncharacterized protein n=1 Tax=Mycobacterium ahvazicum TaxID=1964395 RepID=A0A2K4YB14_9MYCO|nr:hypothetical protein MAAFP003_2647 [Mycobacterium ahvazicum]
MLVADERRNGEDVDPQAVFTVATSDYSPLSAAELTPQVAE